MALLILTDLDGSLLDHEDYSWHDARPALERIRQASVPLVFVTSKTRSEVETLQRQLAIEEPFVVENGGGVFFPPRYDELELPAAEVLDRYRLIRLGDSYTRVRAFVEEARPRFDVLGFGDLSAEEIAELADLSLKDAELARQRDFAEPFLLDPVERIDELTALARREGLEVTRGGRFFHLMGRGQDKGRAVEIVVGVFERNSVERPVTLGLGDSPNDLPMLERVDIPIVIPRLGGGQLEMEREDVRMARFPGSKGWNEAVLGVLAEEGMGPE